MKKKEASLEKVLERLAKELDPEDVFTITFRNGWAIEVTVKNIYIFN